MFKLSNDLQKKVVLSQNALLDRDVARFAMSCLDLTSLDGGETKAYIQDLYDAARVNDVSSLCVLPDKLSFLKGVKKQEKPVLATVINFPFGSKRTYSDDTATSETTAEDISKAIALGARQIDIVLDYKSFLSGEKNKALDLLKICREGCHDNIKMKVILETATFDDTRSLIDACRRVIGVGADCLKTSTGRHVSGGATLETAAILMHEAYVNHRPQIGVKISGGVNDKNCAQFITLAHSMVAGKRDITPDLFRIGASSLLNDLLQHLQCSLSVESPDFTFNRSTSPPKLQVV